MRESKKFEVWKISRFLVKDVYLINKNFQEAEKFRLTSELRRAAVSISAYIAESVGR